MHPYLTIEDQAWLDACPAGDARSLVSCGRSFTVDRRSVGGTPFGDANPLSAALAAGFARYGEHCTQGARLAYASPSTES